MAQLSLDEVLAIITTKMSSESRNPTHLNVLVGFGAVSLDSFADWISLEHFEAHAGLLQLVNDTKINCFCHYCLL